MSIPVLIDSLSPPEIGLLSVLLDEIAGARSAPIVLPTPNDPALRSVAQRWLRQPDGEAGLEVLAAAAGLSRRGLSRNFKAETGLSVGRWRPLARLIPGLISEQSLLRHLSTDLRSRGTARTCQCW